MTRLVSIAVEDMDLSVKLISRSTNMFALGLVSWMDDRTLDPTINFIKNKFAKRPELVEANIRALKAGYNYGDTIEEFQHIITVSKAEFEPGVYRNIVGNQALCFGLITAAEKAGLDIYFAGYPITPASDILQILSGYKNFRVKTFQAEDEIAVANSVLGASFT